MTNSGSSSTFPFINLGFIKLPLYGLMIVTGILSAGAICKRLCAIQNINFYDFIIISATAGALGFAGAKLFFLFDYYGAANFFKALGQMLLHPKTSGLISGGFVFYGGLIGGLAGYLIGIKIARVGMTTFLNTFAFTIPYVHAFGRIGCFCAGCCYGIEYHGFPAVAGRFPVQLMEAFLLFAFAFVMLFLIMRKEHMQTKGLPLFLWYILYYSIVRFCLEFLRADERGQFLFGKNFVLSVSQLVSLIFFIADAILIIMLLIKKAKNDKVEVKDIQND